MSKKAFYVCNIIANGEEDYESLLGHLGSYPVFISRTISEELYFDTPTLIVGWNCVKDIFPKQNIIDKNIVSNLCWSFSKSENEKGFFRDVEDFFNESLRSWLPSDFRVYDSYLNKESLQDFVFKNINNEKNTFVYFHNGALYMYNDENNFIINIKSLSNMYDNFREILSNVFNSIKTVSFSYNNFFNYIEIGLIKDVLVMDSLRWVKYGVETTESYFNLIPNFKIHKYIPFLMSKVNKIELNFYEQNFYKRMCKRDEITCWLSNREIAFSPTFENSKLNFKIRKNYKLAKIKFSNKRTITGRITSADSYNPQNLDKKNDERKDIISRFENGRLLVFDYVSFEPKISVYETKNEEYISKHESHDLHREVARLLYEIDDISNITDEQRMFAKNITNPLIYGQSESSLLEKLSIYKEPAYKLYQVKEFLRPIIEKSNKVNDEVKEHGFVITPQGSIIKPEKYYAGYNNYIQAYASEIIVEKLFEIKELLKCYKTQFIFQVHDSLVFDLHPEEYFLIEKIKVLLSEYDNMQFGVGMSIGPNYKDLEKLYI